MRGHHLAGSKWVIVPATMEVGGHILYREYLRHGDFDRVSQSIANQMDRIWKKQLREQKIDFSDFEIMKKLLIVRLIPEKGNEEFIKKIPYRKIGDMVLTYWFSLEIGDGKQMSINRMVTNEMLEMYGVSAEQLHDDAMTEAPKNRPKVLKKALENDVKTGPFGDNTLIKGGVIKGPVYKAFLKDDPYGSAVISYPGFLERVSKEMDGDYYVLPASTLGCVIVKDLKAFNAEAINRVVKDLYEVVTGDWDRLSEQAFHYDVKGKRLETLSLEAEQKNTEEVT